jgi:formylglycine-generating enzyme required for sulfatase activity
MAIVVLFLAVGLGLWSLGGNKPEAGTTGNGGAPGTQRMMAEGARKPQRPSLAKASFDEAEAKRLQQVWAAYLGRRVEEVVNLGGGVTMEFVLVPPGTFLMGSPPEEVDRGEDEVQHEATLPRPFYVSKYPVTQQQYQCLGIKNPSEFAPAGRKKDEVQGLDTSRFPVEYVSWSEAAAFCNALSKRQGISSSQWCYEMVDGSSKSKEDSLSLSGYRLPTEAEWEYACRAGTTTPFWFGTALNGIQANCNGTVPYGIPLNGPYLKRTCSVGSYAPNAFGLYDMHGNVWQWCQERYGAYAVDKGNDPEGPAAGKVGVVRGGSWVDVARSCRAANRFKFECGYRAVTVGFRVAFRPD